MISWIQETFHKHMKLIFGLLLVIIIIPFVFTIGKMPGIGRDSQKVGPYMYYGYNLRSPKDLGFLQNAAMVSVLMRMGIPIFNEAMFEYEIRKRPALLHLADTLHIPNPNEAEFNDHLKKMRLFADEEGAFDRENYNQFLKDLEDNPNIQEGMIAQVLEQDYRIQRVESLLQGPGYSMDIEAKLFFNLSHTEWNIQTASLPFDESFRPEVDVKTEDLSAFYEENKDDYAKPPKIRFSYLVWQKDAFIPQFERPDEEALKAYFEANSFAFMKEDAEAPEYDAVKDEVFYAYRDEKLLSMAQEAAYAAQAKWFDQKLGYPSIEFSNWVQSEGMKLAQYGLYEQGSSPDNLPVSPFQVNRLFGLPGNKYATDPVFGKDGVYVLLKDEEIPMQYPDFLEVEDLLVKDYVAVKQFEQFKEKSQALHASLLEALSKGTSFKEASEAMKLSVTDYPDSFTLQSPPRGIPPALFEKLSKTKIGEVTEPFISPRESVYVYVQSRKLPEVNEEKQKSYDDIMAYLHANGKNVMGQRYAQVIMEAGMTDENDKD